MKKGLIKKIGLLSVLMTTCFTLTGCDIENVVSGYRESVNKRVEYNLTLLKDLQKVGLITQAMYDNCEANIRENTKELASLSNTNLSEVKKGIIKQATTYRIDKSSAVHFDSIESIFYGCSSSNHIYETDTKGWYCAWERDYPTLHNWGEQIPKNLNSFLGSPDIHGIVSSPKAINIFSEKDENNSGNSTSINTILNAEIYVLDHTALTGQDLSNIAISCKTIKDLKDKKDLTTDEEQALNDARSNMVSFKASGMTLLDGLTDSDGNPIDSLTHETEFNQKAYDAAINNGLEGIRESEVNGSTAYDIGYDLAIFSDYVPVFALRLYEINPKAVQALIDKCKSSQDAYLIDYHTGNKNESIRIYKMIYPVDYIESITWDGSKAKFSTSESEYMNVNIMTGEVALTEESTLLSMEEKEKIEKIYNVTGNSDNISSFMIWDEREFTENFDDGTTKNYKANSILLTDYLEYTYLPDFIPGEPFAALGRRVKFYDINTDGTFKNPNEIAKFIDKTGRPIDDVKSISLDDLLDVRSGNSSNERVAIKSSKSGVVGQTIGGNNQSSQGTTSGNSTNNSNSSSTNDYKVDDPNNAFYLAGTWEDAGSGSWKFKLSDGTYIADTWAWIDGNGDNVAECYNFSSDGKMAADTSIDSFDVNSDGAWVVNGDVQTLDVDGVDPDNDNSSTTTNAGNNGGTVVANTGQNDTGFASDKLKHSFDTYEYVDELHPIINFPADDSTYDFELAGSDAMYNSTDKSRTIMYGICTDVSMFDSQLYSGWININGDGGNIGSLNWWNQWLAQAKYTYHIDKESLMDYLGMNFTADMLGEDNSVVILDVETVRKIKEDMDEQDQVYRVTWIRTMFVIIGYITMIYAFMFMAAWVVDVSTVGETRFMTIMSFGKCVAIRDEIEKPYYDDSGTAYLTFSSTLIRAITMLVLSLILTRMDFISILVNSFGKISGLAQEVLRRIFNV